VASRGYVLLTYDVCPKGICSVLLLQSTRVPWQGGSSRGLDNAFDDASNSLCYYVSDFL